MAVETVEPPLRPARPRGAAARVSWWFRHHSPLKRRPYLAEPNYYRLTYQLAAQQLHEVLDTRGAGTASLGEEARTELTSARVTIDELTEQVDVVVAWLGDTTLPRRFWVSLARRGRRDSTKRLRRFLTRTMQPSALTLAAGVRVELLVGQEDTGPVGDAERLAARVRDADWRELSPRALYNLACYEAALVAIPGHAERAPRRAIDALREALRRSHGRQRHELVRWARYDPAFRRALKDPVFSHDFDALLGLYRPGDAVEQAPVAIGEYADRDGYDAAFLGDGKLLVPLPKLSTAQLQDAARVAGAAEDDPHVLRYRHFSIVMNRARRLAFFAALNIDANQLRWTRDRAEWRPDPRIPASAQAGEEIYDGAPFERGHLVGRMGPAWAETSADAQLASNDTAHFTNAVPFPKDAGVWAAVEEYLLATYDRVSVFVGPVLADEDPRHDDFAVPRSWWKLVAAARPEGGLIAFGFLLESELSAADAYRTRQVSVADIEGLTGLSFDALAKASPALEDAGDLHVE